MPTFRSYPVVTTTLSTDAIVMERLGVGTVYIEVGDFGGGGAGVSSFNGRGGAVTLFSSDVTGALGFVPVNRGGDAMTGKLVMEQSTTAAAGINLPEGVAPTTPLNGDMWTTTTGVFARIEGTTVQLGAVSAPGVTSFNTRTGVVTLSITDVTTALGYTPINKAGDTFTGKVTFPSSTTTRSGVNLGQGVAPTSPGNGDLWATSSSVFARVGGSTIDLGSGGGGSFDQNTTYGLGGNTTAVRSTATRFLDRVSFLDYGAVGDGVTDNTAAINAWISDVNSLVNPSLYVPPGTYLFTGNTTTITESFAIFGAGMNASVLKTLGVTTTFINAQAGPHRTWQIDNIAIVSGDTTPAQQFAEFTHTTSTSPTIQLMMSNVLIGPGFKWGVRTVNVIGAYFYNVTVTNFPILTHANRILMPWAFKTDAAAGFFALSHVWTGCECYYLDTAYTGTGDLQGFIWQGCFTEFVETGWEYTAAGGGSPAMQIAGGQSECFFRGAHFTNFAYVQISDAQFYVDTTCTAIELDTCLTFDIHDNEFVNIDASLCDDIVIRAGNVGKIHHNTHSSSTSHGAYLDSTTVYVAVSDEMFNTGAGTCIPYTNANTSGTGTTNTRRRQLGLTGGPDPGLATAAAAASQTMTTTPTVYCSTPLSCWAGDRIQLQGVVSVFGLTGGAQGLNARIREFTHRPGSANPYNVIVTGQDQNFLFDLRYRPTGATATTITYTFEGFVDVIESATDAVYVLEIWTDAGTATNTTLQLRTERQ